MKKFKSLSAAVCIVALMILSACTNSSSVPRSNVTVTLNGAETISARGISSRTLLPEEMPEISTYTISIAQINGEGIISDSNMEFSFDDGSLTEFTLTNVPLGTYTIVVEGLDKEAKKVVRGTSDKNFSVSADGDNTVNVNLSLISSDDGNEELKGYASMTFDWSAVISNENIKNAMEKGGLVFYLYYFDELNEEWSEPIKSSATGNSATIYEFVAELPVSTGLRLKYALATSSDIMLNPSLTTTVAQIYAGLKSVQKGTEGYVYYISENEISSATNVYNVSYEYGTGDNLGTSVILEWNNQMQNGSSLFEKVIVRYTSTGGASGEVSVTVRPSDSTSSVEIENMTPGDEYTFTFEAYHTSGLVSPIYTYENTVTTEVLVKAPVVTASPSGLSINLSWDAVENATTYTVERKDGNGSYSIIADKISKTSYTDTNVKSGETYTYRVKAFGDSVESEYSTETTPIDISDSIITITPPSGADYEDFEISLSTPEVLVLTEDNPLTFYVDDIPDVTEYTWLLNGEEAETGKSITIDINNTLLDNNLVSVADKLVLEIRTSNNKVYCSEEIKFAVGEDSVDTGLTINYTGPTRLSSESAQNTARTLNLQEYVTVSGGNNVIQEVSYSVTGGNKALAEVNEKTGVIKFINPDESTTDFSVTITATSFGGYSDSVTFDVYYVVVSDAKTLLDKINAVIKSLMIEADTEFGSDWWEFTVNDKQFTTIPKVTVQRNNATAAGKDHQLGYISFDSFSQNIENIGSVTLTGTVTIDSEENGIWGYAGDNRLNYFGNGNSGYDDTIYIELPYNQGEASIKYNKINVLTRSNSGTYQIEFDGYDRLDLIEKLDDNSQITSVIY